VRVRPLLENEIQKGHLSHLLKVDDNKSQIVVEQPGGKDQKNYQFDKIITEQ
jgi:hypothetical protein